MAEVCLTAGLLIANIAAMCVGIYAANRAKHHRREARGSANYAREARADAGRSADQARKAVAEINNPADVVPFTPAALWHEAGCPIETYE